MSLKLCTVLLIISIMNSRMSGTTVSERGEKEKSGEQLEKIVHEAVNLSHRALFLVNQTGNTVKQIVGHKKDSVKKNLELAENAAKSSVKAAETAQRLLTEAKSKGNIQEPGEKMSEIHNMAKTSFEEAKTAIHLCSQVITEIKPYLNPQQKQIAKQTVNKMKIDESIGHRTFIGGIKFIIVQIKAALDMAIAFLDYLELPEEQKPKPKNL